MQTNPPRSDHDGGNRAGAFARRAGIVVTAVSP
jgi:hypothetical protein